MDNLTHSLAAALASELALVWCPKPQQKALRVPFYTSCLFSSNLPDADFLYAFITDGKLGYLLHHRGHTHTLLGAVALSVCVFWVSWLLFRRRDSVNKQLLGRGLLVLSLSGGLLHIAMDYGNNYGVHPFWPVDNRWFYGDTIFIVEPLLIVVLAGTLAFTVVSRLARLFMLGLVCVSVLLPWWFPVPRLSQIGIIVLALTVLGANYLAKRHSLRVGIALAFTGLVYGLLFVAGRLVEARLQTMLASATPSERVLDIVQTPLPTAPYCVSLIVVRASPSQLVLEAGRTSLLPELVPAEACNVLETARTLPLEPMPEQELNGALYWEGRFAMSRESLRKRLRSCWFAAFLRFARAPFALTLAPQSDSAVREGDSAGATIVGDLRYDRSRDLGFAELELPAAESCPRFVPPWIPPRADYLSNKRSSLRSNL